MRKLFRNDIQIGLCLAWCNSIPQPANDKIAVRAAVAQLGVRRRQRQKEIRCRWILHGLRHYADHRVHVLVQLNPLTQDFGVGPKMRFPKGVAQHGYVAFARLSLAFIEHAAHKCARPQHAEKGRRGKLCLHVSGIAGAGQAHVRVLAHGQFFK